MTDLPISLLSAALAALLNVWLAMRTGKVRMAEKILHGDGGHGLLAQRMRAHANFVEYTPFALILILVLEISGRGGWLLAMAAVAFLFGRVLHAIGMDADYAARPRMIGMILTLPLMLGLAVWAILAAFRII